MAEEKKFNKVAYNNKFISEAYDRINLTVKKGKKDIIKEHAAAQGESVNEYIGRAIDERMERDGEGEQ